MNAMKMNPMREIKIEKLTLNIGAGKEQSKLDKSVLLLKNISGRSPIKTFTNKRIQEWDLRPGLPIGCKVTLRKSEAKELLVRLLDAKDNTETAPYFLTLDIPVSEEEPYGPSPYLECNGQCNWTLPGYFGLHGVNGDETKLSDKNQGSSGCVRHSDEDITYLFNLLEPEKEEIRYYIEDI